MPASQTFLMPGCMLITPTSRRINVSASLFYSIRQCLYSNSCCSLRRGAPHFGCRGWSHLPALAYLHQRCRHVAESSEQSHYTTDDSPASSVVRQQQRHTPQIEVGDSRNEAQDLPARTLCR